VKTFSVYDLPNLKLWLKADDVVKDGSNYVSQWNDNSGNGFHPIQATGTYQPLWVDNELNGHPVIRFDGADDFLDVSFGQTFEQPNAIFIVWKANNETSTAFSTDATNYVNGSFYTTSNQISLDFGTRIRTSNTNVFGNNVLNTLIGNGINSHIRENAVSLTNGNTGNNPINIFSVGKLSGYSGWWLSGNVAEIIYCNSLLTETQRQFVEEYLMNKYNLS